MTFNQNWRRESGESRTEEYRRWRTTLGVGAVGDIDQMEYGARDGQPVLAIELCVADRRSPECPAGIPPHFPPSSRFLDQVVQKVSRDRPQGRLARSVTRALGIRLLLVVYIKGELERSGVWIKLMDTDARWQAMSLRAFARRLQQLHGQRDVERAG